MNNNCLLIIAVTILMLCMGNNASAQITINVPGFPKVKKSKPAEQTKTDDQVPILERESPKTNEVPYENTDGRIMLFLDEVAKARKEIEEYTPATRTAFVRGGYMEWLDRAIIPSERKEFFDNWGKLMSAKNRAAFTTHLDAIEAAAAVKIPLNNAQPKLYLVRNAAEERMMKDVMSDVPGLVIHKIGLAATQWQIEKNDFGIPTYRYKRGFIWGRNPTSEHPYCRFYYIHIRQDYAGAGTYAASHPVYVGGELTGCPASK